MERVIRISSLYDAASPILCGQITEEDRITERKVKSSKKEEKENGNHEKTGDDYI